MLNNCVICRSDFEGLGNNAHPVSLYGECCKNCDDTKVIPARMLQLHYEKKYQSKDLAEFIIRNLIHSGWTPEKSIKMLQDNRNDKTTALLKSSNLLDRIDSINEKKYYGADNVLTNRGGA